MQTYHFTTACPKCGKPKALKTVALVAGSMVSATTKPCGKCGFRIG